MRISHVKIQNFRSLQDLDVDVHEDYTTLIGKNDCGKSSFLKALEYLFDPECRLSPSDVCGFRDEGAETYVEATISGCWHSDSQGEILKVRRVYSERGNDLLYREGPVPSLPLLKNMSQGVCTRQLLD